MRTRGEESDVVMASLRGSGLSAEGEEEADEAKPASDEGAFAGKRFVDVAGGLGRGSRGMGSFACPPVKCV